jgi:hypothetical protein
VQHQPEHQRRKTKLLGIGIIVNVNAICQIASLFSVSALALGLPCPRIRKEFMAFTAPMKGMHDHHTGEHGQFLVPLTELTALISRHLSNASIINDKNSYLLALYKRQRQRRGQLGISFYLAANKIQKLCHS